MTTVILGRLAVRPCVDRLWSFDSIFRVVSNSDDCLMGVDEKNTILNIIIEFMMNASRGGNR